MTQRDLQVRDLLMEGYSDKEIAQHLGISVRTVKVYTHRLFVNYGVQQSSGLKRIKLAIAIFNAGHCRCSRCAGRSIQP